MEPTKAKDNITLVELKQLESSSERLGREIRMISRSFKAMSRTGLKRETLITLLHDSSGVKKTDIRLIMDALNGLESKYLEKEPVNQK